MFKFYAARSLKMFSSKAVAMIFAVVVVGCGLIEVNQAMPSIAHYGKRYDTGFDIIPICLNNCVQCKNMYGDYFQGQTCAESCLKFNGKAIPDCLDRVSIAPFLNVLE